MPGFKRYNLFIPMFVDPAYVMEDEDEEGRWVEYADILPLLREARALAQFAQVIAPSVDALFERHGINNDTQRMILQGFQAQADAFLTATAAIAEEKGVEG